ncbi:AraC family transcriptional regulator [Sporomusa sphaeroides]|uniref:Arabinose operon regulatory protein n=2 Tax=Sporomusa TaxID=2375 RepID=A0ABP2C6M4_9FIRM|nr:AraC family transcriptional regulator [Sporomusa sphaeroides]OLS54820.1 arabinose operon regulatory protein [Sporomusa sphaeroides DSM 2875]CVK20031.1 Arabinose operon regulatory protein [Sporomusa sphaeroides DSM 2875]SCM82998.1 Helix-turn-helix, AraC domain-containing protein [uncultured Sporomusa sp.]
MHVDINQLAGNFTRNRFQIVDVVRAIVPPGGRCFGMFTPPVSGLIFPLRGRARMFFDGVPYTMEPGKIFHGGPNISMDKEVVGSAEWNYMVIHYQVDNSAKNEFPQAFSHYQIDTGYSPRIHDLLQRLYDVCTTPGNLSALQAHSLFLSILDESLTCAGSRHSEPGRELVEQAVEYIKQHYMEPLTVAKLARKYGLNSKQFAYLFQKHIGMAPLEYLIEHRVRRAREMLYTTACSVTDISACVGYSDPYYFSKLFKKRTGFSPSTLRPASCRS